LKYLGAVQPEPVNHHIIMKTFLIGLREWIKFKLLRPFLLGTGNVIGKYSAVGDLPVFDNSDFPWTKMLEEHWQEIRKELEAVLELHAMLPSLQDIQQEQKVLNQDDKWRTFFLYGFGKKATLNCQTCPVTTELLEQIPDMTTAFFSVLSPHKHIPAHKGIYKGIIRSHLGLIIPGKPGDCVMRVETDQIHWQEGKVVVFDDTYDHEVWNHTGEIRVVLLVDVVRPFRFPFSTLNHAILRLIGNSSFVKQAQENHRKWEARFHAENRVAICVP
jgi:beta-hydroxylase